MCWTDEKECMRERESGGDTCWTDERERARKRRGHIAVMLREIKRGNGRQIAGVNV